MIDAESVHLDPVEEFSTLKLISSDGHEFYLDKRIAFECDTFGEIPHWWAKRVQKRKRRRCTCYGKAW